MILDDEDSETLCCTIGLLLAFREYAAPPDEVIMLGLIGRRNDQQVFLPLSSIFPCYRCCFCFCFYSKYSILRPAFRHFM